MNSVVAVEIEKYRHGVLFLCLALAALAVWVFSYHPAYLPALLAGVAVMPVLVRQIKSRPVKILSYLSLGFVSYLAVAQSFIVPEGSEELLFSFVPFLILAVANAIGVLIGYSDSYVCGGVYTAGAVLALLFGKGPVDFLSVDRFVIGIVLFTCSSFVFVQLISRNSGVRESIWSVIEGCVVAALLFTVMFSIRFLSIEMIYPIQFDVLSKKVAPLFVNLLWRLLVSNSFVIILGLIIHDLMMYAFELTRQIEGGEVLYSKMGVKREEEGEEEVFSSFILRLRKFIQDLPDYDVSAASNVLRRFEVEFEALSAEHEGGDEAKALLAKAKKLVKELEDEEIPKKQRQLSFKRSDMIELPKNSTVLVEGPIGSRKEEYCLRFLKLALQKGKSVAICSYDPDEELEWFSKEERGRIEPFKVEPDITEMSLVITKVAESKPEVAYFNVLYKLLPSYSGDVLSEFLSSNLRKLKKGGVTGIFVMEKEMISSQLLSVVESLFDGIIEFQIREEGDELVSYYRIRTFKLKEFDTNWREFK